MNFELIEHYELPGIASASGIEITPLGIFIIGDDAPWLYKLEDDFTISRKMALMNHLPLEDGIFSKAIKPDLEALCKATGEGDVLYAFGSGSKSPYRDLLLEINLRVDTNVKVYSLELFYHQLRKVANLSKQHLNIEAAEIYRDSLYLFNRGKNRIFKYSVENFKKYLQGIAEVPNPIVYKFTLPHIKGLEAGFSGVTFHSLEEAFIFTATVEDTTNWIDDGEVLGSFLGIIRIEGMLENTIPEYTLIQKNNKPWKIKIESLSIISPLYEKKANLLLVSDSDGGISEVLKGCLYF